MKRSGARENVAGTESHATCERVGAGAAPPAPGGRGTELRPARGGVGGGPQLGVRGGRAEAPGRGAHLWRQGVRAVVRPQMRGAAAREQEASARGAARGKRAAAQLEAMTTTRVSAGRAVAVPVEAKQRSRSDGCFAGGGWAFPGRGRFPGGRWPAGAGGGRWKRRAAERLCERAGRWTAARARAARSGA